MMSSTLYLLGSPLSDLLGSSLPCNAEMLRYYHHLRGIHTVHYSVRRAVSRCYEIWEKAGLPTSPMSLAIAQMQRLVDEYGRIEKRKRRGKVVKVRRFSNELRVLFFVGREDAMEKCGEKARKLLVASLMLSLGKQEEECEVEFEASDDNAKLKLKPEPNNNNIDKKCEYWNWLDHDEKRWKMDLEPKHCDFWNSIGGYKVRPKIKIEPTVRNKVYNCSALDKKKMDFQPSVKLCDFRNKVRSKTKIEPIVSNNCLADDEMRVKMGLEPTDKSKNPEYWNFFDDVQSKTEVEPTDKSKNPEYRNFFDIQPKMEVEPSITYNDDDYAAYAFEEEWNLRYPKYDDGSMTFAFVSVN